MSLESYIIIGSVFDCDFIYTYITRIVYLRYEPIVNEIKNANGFTNK